MPRASGGKGADLMGYKSSARGQAPVIWITGHTAQGARTKESLGNYFFRPDIQASSHVGIDAGGTVQYVPYSRAAWTLRGGNPISDNAELCGFAEWTRSEWLSTGIVDGCVNPRKMLRNFSLWARARCLARGIPLRKLTVSQVAGHHAGIIHHHDYTQATGDGTHWDMGFGVPWDVVLFDVINPEVPMADSPAILDLGYRVNALVRGEEVQGGGPGEGDALPMISHLLAAVYRLEAVAHMRGSSIGGPKQGEPIELTSTLIGLGERLDQVNTKLDTLLNNNS